MSAFVVGDKIISKIVSYLTSSCDYEIDGYDLKIDGEAEALASDMFKLNCEAVNDRYGEGAAEFSQLNFEYHFVVPQLTVKTAKALDCWLYQCTEGDVPNSFLYNAMERVRDAMYRRIVHRLPEYELAEWG